MIESQSFYPLHYQTDGQGGYPQRNDFTLTVIDDSCGSGIIARRNFKPGELVARISGDIVAEVKLHTLQINPTQHLFDPYFSGYLLHSCCPNAILDMQAFEIWALRTIQAGELLTIDYTMTEDVLARQFACLCQSPQCRLWITGRKETTNEAGRQYLQIKDEAFTPQQSSAVSLWWERPDLCYQENRLTFAGRDVVTIARQSGKPTFLYDAHRVSHNLRKLTVALGQANIPYRIFYAMKANRFMPLLTYIKSTQLCGVDVCSPQEIQLALACGFAEHEISYTGCSVSDPDLDALLRYPLLLLNCDSLSMIRRVGERTPGRSIGLRINPALGVSYDNNELLQYSGAQPSKFGIYREQFAEALALCRQYGLSVERIHFHSGCGYLNDQLATWEQVLQNCRWFLDQVADLKAINIGGGLGVAHKSSDTSLDLSAWIEIIQRNLSSYNVEIQVEPGDYIVKDAGLLVLQVTMRETKQDTCFVGVNGGFNLAIEPAFYNLPCEPAVCVLAADDPEALAPEQWKPVTIVGNINEALDIWYENFPLAPVKEGDYLAFLNAGGYAAAMSSNHCMRGDFAEQLFIGRPLQTGG
jgi:diaminopimelate decarboxylase